jgi:predicted ATPase
MWRGILLIFPGADIISFDDGRLERTDLKQTSHYQVTRGVLENPEQYWKHLREAGSDADSEK